jgi:hydrogenase nickel incorporation protein HypA/HybF
MHELSITENLLQIVLKHAGGRRVVAVDLLIGELSSYVDESVRMIWEMLAAGTLAEGSQLRFRREPGTLYCMDCEKEFSIHEPAFTCPACGGTRSRPGRGRECFVESLEVEEDQES